MRRFPLLAAAALAGCTSGIGGTLVRGDAQESACREAYAERLGLPMSTIEIGERGTGPGGEATLAMLTVDGRDRATCTVDAEGRVLDVSG